VHAVELFEQVDQAVVEDRPLDRDEKLVGGVRAVAAEDAHLADVDAEPAEHRGDLPERAGQVG
jgi:hypothetical protein